MKYRTLITLLTASLVLGGCVNTGRYTIKNDKAPLRKPTTLEMIDQVPQYEPIYRWSLKPYTVLGKSYQPLGSAENFEQSGVASWYGRKFHGHQTANGEVYDMYAMSAAHKTLPIPTYVRVTNLENKKSIIVRVNDRGPFHDNRVIDLSYSAAYALDMLNTGTAKVHLEAIVVPQGENWQPGEISPAQQSIVTKNDSKAVTTIPGAPIETDPFIASENAVDAETSQNTQPQNSQPLSAAKQLFVQVAAASNEARITEKAKRLASLFGTGKHIPLENGVYKLRLGPLKDKQTALALISSLKNNGYPNAYMLYSEPLLPHN